MTDTEYLALYERLAQFGPYLAHDANDYPMVRRCVGWHENVWFEANSTGTSYGWRFLDDRDRVALQDAAEAAAQEISQIEHGWTRAGDLDEVFGASALTFENLSTRQRFYTTSLFRTAEDRDAFIAANSTPVRGRDGYQPRKINIRGNDGGYRLVPVAPAGSKSDPFHLPW